MVLNLVLFCVELTHFPFCFLHFFWVLSFSQKRIHVRLGVGHKYWWLILGVCRVSQPIH